MAHPDQGYGEKVRPALLEKVPQTYEDTSFTSGDSPVTLDVENDLALHGVVKSGETGYIKNDGPGSFTVEVKCDDEGNWSDSFTLKSRERYRFEGLRIRQIRITHVDDSAYRVFVT